MTVLERRPTAPTYGQPQILFLYQYHWMHIKTVAHHLEAFHRFSRFDVSYVSSVSKCRFKLDEFAAIVIHYTSRICHPGHIGPSWYEALREYTGVKAVYLQDEYENVHLAHKTMTDLQFDFVFTCVPDGEIEKVYPQRLFRKTKFVNVLTGYVPLDVDQIPEGPPMEQRKTLIGYRGRNLGYWYGDLGQEKADIGRRMKRACRKRNLLCDIGWEEKDRIYGDDWFRFLGSSRATLATESGATIFDWDGTLREKIQKELLQNPDATYQEIRARYFPDREGEVVMNQISPKLFEAIACGTALILYEGEYSGVLQPDKHYIPLRKDFTNVDDVLAKLQDVELLKRMPRQAYADVVASGKYSYQSFIELFDRTIGPRLRPRTRTNITHLPMPRCDTTLEVQLEYSGIQRLPLIKRMWRRLPEGLRARIKPFFGYPGHYRVQLAVVRNAAARAVRPARRALSPAARYVRKIFKKAA